MIPPSDETKHQDFLCIMDEPLIILEVLHSVDLLIWEMHIQHLLVVTLAEEKNYKMYIAEKRKRDRHLCLTPPHDDEGPPAPEVDDLTLYH